VLLYHDSVAEAPTRCDDSNGRPQELADLLKPLLPGRARLALEGWYRAVVAISPANLTAEDVSASGEMLQVS
jgi:hypothetical protein